jgi:uncharacterized oxidoreductase
VPTIAPDQLESFATQLLQAGGLDQSEAALVAKSLVGANLRGHDSHGVMRIPSYLDAYRKGDVVAGAKLSEIRRSPTIFAADGHWGFGQSLAQELTRTLIDMARESGLALGTLIRSSHIGRLGEYCEMAADAGLVSMVMVNTHGHARRVAPPGGIAPRLGTNPLAIGVPAEPGQLVLDFGTSATAEGKVRVKRIAGEKCPDGWLLDCEGKPTNDPHTLYGNPPGTILPMGGMQGGYKGFGLGLMIEIFAGALSGGVCIREVPINQNGNCVFMLLIDPGHVGGREHFAREVADLAEFIRSCPRAAGVAEILLPGDPERRTLAQRSKGIPLDDGNWNELVKLARQLGVSVPS